MYMYINGVCICTCNTNECVYGIVILFNTNVCICIMGVYVCTCM